jgi:enterochelin esterase-like enzyme
MLSFTRGIFISFLAVAAMTGLQAQEKDMLEMIKSFQWDSPATERQTEGVEHRVFYSQANKTDVGYYVSFPGGYDNPENVGERYPVIYYLHGGRPGAESKGLSGFRNFRASRAGDRLPPHIFVMVNGGKLSHYDYVDGYLGVQAFMEFVQHLDETQRTLADRGSRVLIGSSQGGRGVGRYLFRYPELFATGVSIAGGHQRELIISENEGSELNGIVIPDASNNVFDNAMAYAARGDDAPRVNLMVVIGNEDDNYPGNLIWCARLAELGIKHELMVVPGTGHGVDFDIEGSRERVWRFISNGLRGEVSSQE